MAADLCQVPGCDRPIEESIVFCRAHRAQALRGERFRSDLEIRPRQTRELWRLTNGVRAVFVRNRRGKWNARLSGPRGYRYRFQQASLSLAKHHAVSQLVGWAMRDGPEVNEWLE